MNNGCICCTVRGDLIRIIEGLMRRRGRFDAIIVGVYRGEDLMFAGRVRAGFVPATRREVFAAIQRLKTAQCPFANLPEARSGRWGEGLTAEKMKECVWVRPELVAEVEFVEWTPEGHLRHSRFVGMRVG